MHGGRDVRPRCGQEVAAQRRVRRERDGMEHAVERAPSTTELVSDGRDVGVVGHVELQHVHRSGQARRSSLREPLAPAEAGQDDVRALLLCLLGDVERDGPRVQYPGDEQPASLEQHVVLPLCDVRVLDLRGFVRRCVDVYGRVR